MSLTATANVRPAPRSPEERVALLQRQLAELHAQHAVLVQAARRTVELLQAALEGRPPLHEALHSTCCHLQHALDGAAGAAPGPQGGRT